MVKAPQDSGVQRRWCRVVNEELATAVKGTTHTRFLAALPETDGGAAADELERAVGDGAVGGMLAANPEGATLARRDFENLWSRAESVGLPIVLHPGDFLPSPRLGEHFMVNLVGNPFETTLAAATLLASGVPERHPELAVVLVHGGGFLPYQFGRITHGFASWPSLARLGRKPPADLLRWFHYDTVLFDDRPLRFLIDLVGEDRVLAGSDCPFAMTDERPFVGPEGVPAAVTGANAVRLFRL
jgi:predicted TIM-barrel fold metal-dependent hydrolase